MSLALVPTRIAQLLADPSLASTLPRPDRVSLAVAMIASLAGSEVAVPPPIAKNPTGRFSCGPQRRGSGCRTTPSGSGGARHAQRLPVQRRHEAAEVRPEQARRVRPEPRDRDAGGRSTGGSADEVKAPPGRGLGHPAAEPSRGARLVHPVVRVRAWEAWRRPLRAGREDAGEAARKGDPAGR